MRFWREGIDGRVMRERLLWRLVVVLEEEADEDAVVVEVSEELYVS